MSVPNRNDQCPCGSGKKFKKCCLKQEAASAPSKRVEHTSTADPLQQAIAFHQAGHLSQAETIYQLILSNDPNHPDALHLLGVIAQQAGKTELAITLIGKAIMANPLVPSFYSNLGSALVAQGKLDEATGQFYRALQLDPNYLEAHGNLGNALQLQGKLEEAVEHLLKALALKPDYVEAHISLGAVLQAQGKLAAALEHFGKALALRPNYAEAFSSLLFLHGYQSTLDPASYLLLARNWEQACLPPQVRQLAQEKGFQRPALAGRRLRVGYLSGNYCQHAVSFFIEQLFTHHDKAKIELFAYSISETRDAVTVRLQALVENWRSIAGMSDAKVLEQIEADQIDLLVDLSGHTAPNRLGIFACRAAPVQAHYLGFFASTGLTEMDYWIGDEVMTPAAMDEHFSEQVWRLPRIWVSYDGKAEAPLTAWQPSPDGTLWLGSFNNLGKLTTATLALWAKVLHALPKAKLLLKTKEFTDTGNRQRILAALSDLGISPERIELQDNTATPGWSAHMAYYDRVDIALDPVGAVGGGTTTCDALWMGVPVVTLEGDRMASRMTDSMLHAIGHSEWIAYSEAEYVNKIVGLAHDVGLRQMLRSSQRERMAASALCDASGLAASLENAYCEMFERWKK
jgi:predicted O-linked N-acetylglucosamine transferase (SPINDLY family)